MSRANPRWRLKQAAISGAIIGAVMLLLNVYLQGQLAAAGIAAIAMMMLGGAAGGAVLFVVIAVVANFLTRWSD